jgi:flagellar FliL protein
MGHKTEIVAPPPKPLVFFDLPDFLVNLNSGGRKANFLKLTVSLQIEKQEDSLRLQAVMPRIIDNCQIFLRELRVEDLQGAGGIYRLREELLARVNAVSPVKVDDVLFKEMLVQ